MAKFKGSGVDGGLKFGPVGKPNRPTYAQSGPTVAGNSLKVANTSAPRTPPSRLLRTGGPKVTPVRIKGGVPSKKLGNV